MKTRFVLAFVAVFVAGVFIGGSIPRLQSYAQGGVIAQDAKELLQLIEQYRTSNGDYPPRQWFEALDSHRITSEGRLWVYYNPPQDLKGKRQLLISAPVENGRMYMCGYTDGVVMAQPAQNLK